MRITGSVTYVPNTTLYPEQIPSVKQVGNFEEQTPFINSEDEDSVIQQNAYGNMAILSKNGLEKTEEEETNPYGEKELDNEEQQEVRELQQRDREVRQHEQAHISASGSIPTTGPTYETTKGPDGKLYATGGHVNFRMPAAQTPEETLRMAEQMKKMALAPANPSAKDRAVVAQAAQKISEAKMEMAKEEQEEV